MLTVQPMAKTTDFEEFAEKPPESPNLFLQREAGQAELVMSGAQVA